MLPATALLDEGSPLRESGRKKVLWTKIRNVDPSRLKRHLRSRQTDPFGIDAPFERAERRSVRCEHACLSGEFADLDVSARRRRNAEPGYARPIPTIRPRAVVAALEALEEFDPHRVGLDGRPIGERAPRNDILRSQPLP